MGGVVTPRVWGNDPYWMTHEAPRQSLMVAPPDVFLAPPPPPPPPLAPPPFFVQGVATSGSSPESHSRDRSRVTFCRETAAKMT